jgi:hypothetical protein
MKKIITLVFVLSAFVSYSQRMMFGSNNNYVVPTVPIQAPAIVTGSLKLYLDAANPSSYPGSGSLWTDLSGNNNNVTLINNPTFNDINGGSIYTNGNNAVALVYNRALSDAEIMTNFNAVKSRFGL